MFPVLLRSQLCDNPARRMLCIAVDHEDTPLDASLRDQALFPRHAGSTEPLMGFRAVA